jgi:hypothetical protein
VLEQQEMAERLPGGFERRPVDDRPRLADGDRPQHERQTHDGADDADLEQGQRLRGPGDRPPSAPAVDQQRNGEDRRGQRSAGMHGQQTSRANGRQGDDRCSTPGQRLAEQRHERRNQGDSGGVGKQWAAGEQVVREAVERHEDQGNAGGQRNPAAERADQHGQPESGDARQEQHLSIEQGLDRRATTQLTHDRRQHVLGVGIEEGVVFVVVDRAQRARSRVAGVGDEADGVGVEARVPTLMYGVQPADAAHDGHCAENGSGEHTGRDDPVGASVRRGLRRCAAACGGTGGPTPKPRTHGPARSGQRTRRSQHRPRPPCDAQKGRDRTGRRGDAVADQRSCAEARPASQPGGPGDEQPGQHEDSDAEQDQHHVRRLPCRSAWPCPEAARR